MLDEVLVESTRFDIGHIIILVRLTNCAPAGCCRFPKAVITIRSLHTRAKFSTVCPYLGTYGKEQENVWT